jgi:hypothetical protein
MGIETKSLGELIDQLITADIRTWFAQEIIMDESLSLDERFQGALNAQKGNKRRNELIRAIDKLLDQESTPDEKTY